MRDLNDIKEEVRVRADIVDIVSGYTRLKASGKNFTGLCPFHADKKPSFNVSPTFQSYRCWSCGEKGDVFTFIQKKENLTFIEALETLAKRVGVTFERSGYSAERKSEREEMHDLNSLAVSYFREMLARSEEAREYLAKRGILKETQDRFDIGYAPPEWEGLTTHLQRRRANVAVAASIGLLRDRRESPGHIDYYRHRIMFPIHDLNGNVAGFGGRALGDELPKYINSPQSDIFSKSRLLYGLYFAREKFSAGTPPVFVEGYTDVITAHQAGFNQCVATLGTAMTEEHAGILARYNPRVILCYDGDSAGINATLKGAAIWEGLRVDGAELLVARLPTGEDPDSLLKRGDTAAFQLSLDNAIPRVDFEIELVTKRNSTAEAAGRDQALREIVPILATVRGSTNLDRYVQKAAWLHPTYNFNPVRAMESIHADIKMYRAQTKNGTTGRARGHSSVENQNGAPLREPAPPPIYRPAAPPRGRFNPNAKGWVQPGQNQGGWNNRYGGRFDDDVPPGDPTPPDLGLPTLSAAEKAQFSLLRGLLISEWRSYITGKIDIASFITQDARDLAALILKTPPDDGGEIDPRDVIRLIEREHGSSEAPANAQNNHDELQSIEENYPTAGNYSTKMSNYLRDVVEDSESVLSNEPLNEATLSGCVRRLEEHRQALAIREAKHALDRDDLTHQQRQDYMHRLMQLMRAHRGSASGS